MDTLKETQDKQETDDDDDKRWRKWRLTLDEVYDNFSLLSILSFAIFL